VFFYYHSNGRVFFSARRAGSPRRVGVRGNARIEWRGVRDPQDDASIIVYDRILP